MRAKNVILGVFFGVAVIAGVSWLASRGEKAEKPKIPPRESGLPDPSPTEAPFGSELPELWETVGWWTYKGNAPERFWIRVDRGPWRDGMLDDTREWRWTVFRDVPEGDPQGKVPLATEVHTMGDFSLLFEFISGMADDFMTVAMPRSAADWIDDAWEAEEE